MPAGRPLSGRQVELSSGAGEATTAATTAAATTAVVVEVGGGLRRFDIAGEPVLDGYDPAELCSAGRGQLLLPWPNRLAAGRYRFAGQDLQLPVNDPATGSAIHGLARWHRWRVAQLSPDRCEATLDLPAQPGWPFQLEFTAAYQLAPGRLQVSVGARNVGLQPCPFGAGQHPYLRVPVDTTEVRLPAVTRLLLDNGIPTGERRPAERVLSPIGPRQLDDCYTDLEVDADGRWQVEVRPPGGRALRVWGEQGWRYLQLYSGDTVPQVSRRRQGLAVEPMTCPPNALASGEGLIVLQPGQRWAASWGIEVAAG